MVSAKNLTGLHEPSKNRTRGLREILRQFNSESFKFFSQYYAGSTASFWAHTWSPGLGTRVGAGIAATPGQIYAYNLQYDAASGACNLDVWNASGSRLSSTSPMDSDINTSLLLVGSNNHGSNPNVTTRFGKLVIDFDGKRPIGF